MQKRIVLVILGFILVNPSCNPLLGQDILKRLTVTPSSREGRTAVFLDYPDKVGIIIQSALTGLSFESNMDGIVSERHQPDQGQYVLVIEPVAQIITINAQGYMQERLRISGISAKDVRYYVVEPEAVAEGATIPVNFQVTPVDTEVFVYGLGVVGLQQDGQDEAEQELGGQVVGDQQLEGRQISGQKVDISQPVPMEEREYRVVFRRAGYRTVERDVVISITNTLVQQTLEEIEPVVVTIQTNPEASTVALNGVEAGVTDASGRFERFRMPGDYELTVRKSGYVTQTQLVTISEAGSNQFDVELVRNVGSIRLQVEPSDAEVRIDREVRTFDGLMELIPGFYELEITKSGYLPYNEILELGVGETIERSVDLVRNAGTLRLQVDPSDAEVRIDREVRTISGLMELSPGKHRLEVTRDGYAPYSETLDVVRGETISRTIALEGYYGVLQLTTVPYGSQWGLKNNDGIDVRSGTGLARIRDLLVGEYVLEVTSEGHLPKEERVEIRRDETVSLEVVLEEGSLRGWPFDAETEVVDVVNPATGVTWMDRNLGASQVATRSADSQAYGYLYQWGRLADGHEKRISSIRRVLSSGDQPGHKDFIIGSSDWRRPKNDNLWQGVNGANNPCPVWYRLPTATEWETERQSWSSNNSDGAYGSPLRLPAAGRRYADGSLGNVGSSGDYWSSSVDGINARRLGFSSSGASVGSYTRASGRSVRCIKHNEEIEQSVVTSITGAVWMDRNLGAVRAPRSSTDSEAYGDLYQWGRLADGHEKRNSSTRRVLSSNDQPGHWDFILASSFPYDWRSTRNDNLWQGADGMNNPCPVGYRLPTESEWNAERRSWESNNSAGAYSTPLKLTVAGYRGSGSGSLGNVGSHGNYWSSTVTGTSARRLYFTSSYAGISSGSRASGHSVRCIKHEEEIGQSVVTSSTGAVWMDRNLGASRVARSSTDPEGYGDLYQWGRGADGHEKRTSGMTSTLSSSDQPGHGDYILAPNSPWDWRSPMNDNLWQGLNGVNNPCPAGYRLPTEAEWEEERATWSGNNSIGAYSSPLKLPVAGNRDRSDGSLGRVGSYGFYWSSSVDGTYARSLFFFSSLALVSSSNRAYGRSVRCRKD